MPPNSFTRQLRLLLLLLILLPVLADAAGWAGEERVGDGPWLPLHILEPVE